MIKVYQILVFIILSGEIFCQDFSLSGKVIDINQNPVAGANIYLEKVKKGQISGTDGKFNFNKLKKDQYTLHISYVGYLSKVEYVNLKKDIDIIIVLKQGDIKLDSIIITATRFQRSVKDIPGRIAVLTSQEINELPVFNVDDALRSVANVYVNRSWGIFSKNASVTMRGLEGSARTLILLNGVPLNKSAGGSINWHLVNSGNIEKFEIIKGPASALYGNNAMAGVINIITKKPEKGYNGSFSTQIGTYNTLGSNLTLSFNNIENRKGYFTQLNSFYRQGNGYIYEAYETRDTNVEKIALREFSGNLLAGYQWNNHHKFEIDYSYFQDKRGGGTKVYEKDGSYYSLNNDYLNLKYINKYKSVSYSILGFFQIEDYFQQSENINNYGEYKLSESSSKKHDNGLWMNFTKKLWGYNHLSWGLDFKMGDVKSVTTYKTATDILDYQGNLSFYAFFIQDEQELLNNKLKISTGLRFDYARFYNGWLKVTDPSKNTGFIESFEENFNDNSWYSFNPKLALKYLFSERISSYFTVSSGMMPPKLDDLCKSGKIRKGFKLANPELEPEKIITTDLGANFKLVNKISIEPSVYYSLGSDFQYFVGTGDSIDTGGDQLKPVLKRQNISKVEIKGAELTLKYLINENIKLNVSYSYNHSKIKEFELPDSASNNLSGKYLMEVSPHLFYAGLTFQNRYFNTYFSINYIDEQWADDENTILIDDYSLVNIKVYKIFQKHFTTAFEVQNIFNVEYIDRKGRLSPGRFMMFSIKYNFY